MKKTMSMKQSMFVLVGLMAAAPLIAGNTTEFDVSSHPVTNQVAGGKVEISSNTKIEALTTGDILSESVFFFPAKMEQITAALSSPEGINKMAAFSKNVVKT